MDGLGVTKNFESRGLVNQVSNGSSEKLDPLRRQYCRGLAVGMLGFAGCGGSGGGGGGSPDNEERTSTTTGNVPPASGIFGGGQGKMIFVDGGERPKAVKQIDLATRRITGVTRVDSGVFFRIVGGVTRAVDGTFLISESDTRKTKGYLFRSDGSLIQSLELGNPRSGGIVLSPDGRSIAHVDYRLTRHPRTNLLEHEVIVVILDIQAGQKTVGVLVPVTEPVDRLELGLRGRAAWSSDSATIYAVLPGALYRMNRDSGAVERICSISATAPASGAVSPDGKEIWYESARGAIYGQVLWSVDIASGLEVQRTNRSRSGRQYCATFSPDGQWLSMLQGRLDRISVEELRDLAAVPLRNEVLDTQDVEVFVRDSDGKPIDVTGQVAWY